MEGTSEVQGEENGLYDDVTVRHPSSSGIKDCTSTTVPFNLIFLSLSFFSSPESFLCLEEKTHSATL